MKPVYDFVFVNTHMGYEKTYSLLRTNIPLSSLSAIEHSQNLNRSECNSAWAFVEKANNFYFKQDDYFMEVILEEQKEEILSYPRYFGFSGNY